MKTLQRVELLTEDGYDLSHITVRVLNQQTGDTEEYILKSKKAVVHDSIYENYIQLFEDLENYEIIKEFHKGHDFKDLITTFKEHDSDFKIYADTTNQ